MSDYKKIRNRRDFLRNVAGAGCASMSLSPFLSGITNLGLLNATVANSRPKYSSLATDDYKALVCVMLSGGNDSFNMLAPYDEEQYNEYEELRGGAHNTSSNPFGMALNRSDLHQLDINIEGAEYGLHPKLGGIKKLFNGESIIENGVELNPNNEPYLSFVANVGTLSRPDITKSNFDTAKKPHQLFSHSDQLQSWQTSMVGSDRGTTGWGGRVADILLQKNVNANQNISMNISLNSTNIFQNGNDVFAYAIQEYRNSSSNGSVLLAGHSTTPNTRDLNKKKTLEDIFNANYGGVLEQAYANETKDAMASSSLFSTAIVGAPDFDYFPNTSIGRQLRMVAKTMAVKDGLVGTNFSRQTFFVNLKGFDHHSDLIRLHDILMKNLDDAIYAFYRAMKEIDLLDKVTGFTMSDFARSLKANRNGTDHAWGGHHLVFGGAINGGKIIGKYPNLKEDIDTLDVGNGRFIPTTSCDQYFADLATWFGASATDLDTILPNLSSFDYDKNQGLGIFS